MILRNLTKRFISMKAVSCDGFGGPEVMKMKEFPIPVIIIIDLARLTTNQLSV